MDNLNNNQSSQTDPLAFFKNMQEQQDQKAQPYLQNMSNIYNERKGDIKNVKDKLSQNYSDYSKSINSNLPATPEYKNVRQSLGSLGSLTILLMALSSHGNGGQSRALTFAQIYNGMHDSIKKNNIDNYKLQVEQYKNQVERLIAENNLKLNQYNEVTKNLIAGNNLDAQDAAIGIQVDKAGIDNIKNENNTLYKVMNYVEKAQHDADVLSATKNWRETQVDMFNARNELSAIEHGQTIKLGEKRLKQTAEHNNQTRIEKLNSQNIELFKILNNVAITGYWIGDTTKPDTTNTAKPGTTDTFSDQIRNSMKAINDKIIELGGTPAVPTPQKDKGIPKVPNPAAPQAQVKPAAPQTQGTPAAPKELSPEARNAIGSIKNKKKLGDRLTPIEQQIYDAYDAMKQAGMIQ